jgi:hypothetical protein
MAGVDACFMALPHLIEWIGSNPDGHALRYARSPAVQYGMSASRTLVQLEPDPVPHGPDHSRRD